MASFGWKRKVGEKVSKLAAQQFEAADKPPGGAGGQGEEVDWLHAVKRRREILLEDCAAKSKRLTDEGTQLVEQGRHWEAIKKWDEAIQMTPDNPVLYEMKAQVLTILHEVFPAVKAAETAAKLRPLWWEGWQTLGRAQLSLGEVDLALRSFQVAVHLCPSERALWQEDLAWARALHKQNAVAKEKIRREEEAKQQLLNAPELRQDFDFESNEVLDACVAVAERQARYEELKRTAVVVDAEGNVQNVLASGEGGSGDLTAVPSQEQFVKARI
ncbi:tetratricopeptide repeat protein 33 [Entelurus aequoreus]|uniref:tetratricopeptide repeat protein 33-like n=1 Tax=Entelurus aequoreus TaxID=161455 RepID=UPI002B1D16FA|nr:tetratricopeptide repeat protein 33-like [Entelurus aequoreus]XP_061911085.1 tetratricopeptide repeat protein 33-like [Entelurus aequoreus]XP_061911088.1 tetratricopeptide repeat protein 33 [Entelurus aequoreus]